MSKVERYLRKTSAGDLVVDACKTDGEHMDAPPDAYVEGDPGKWRRSCRTYLERLLEPLLGQRVEVSTDGTSTVLLALKSSVDSVVRVHTVGPMFYIWGHQFDHADPKKCLRCGVAWPGSFKAAVDPPMDPCPRAHGGETP